MERIICIAILVLYGVVMLLMCFLQYYTVFKNNEKPKNKVHFYVARDKNSDLVWLYLGKPTRNVFYECWIPQYISLYSECYFERVGLNKNNYKDLKWEDEPVEVFLNLGD